jgi:hypothetical protein
VAISITFGEQTHTHIYGDLYTVEEVGERYIYPTWILA